MDQSQIVLVFSRPEQKPTLESAQSFVGGLVELVNLNDGSQLLVNEEGMLKSLPLNETATILFGEIIGQPLHGPVLHLINNARWLD